ncbi:MAG: hypothetical protein LBG98_02485 [Puniceicoccales bacterium]|nr:hypothetical protein [Puniceicoccales bacterium]
MKAPALHFSLPQRRQAESSRAWEFCLCPKRCCPKRSTKGKREKKDGMEKRTYRRLVSAFHIRSLSLLVP